MPTKSGMMGGTINPYRQEPPLSSLPGIQDSEEAPPIQPVHLWGMATGCPGIHRSDPRAVSKRVPFMNTERMREIVA